MCLAGRFYGECPGRGHRATDRVKARAYHGDSMKGTEQSVSNIQFPGLSPMEERATACFAFLMYKLS